MLFPMWLWKDGRSLLREIQADIVWGNTLLRYSSRWILKFCQAWLLSDCLIELRVHTLERFRSCAHDRACSTELRADVVCVTWRHLFIYLSVEKTATVFSLPLDLLLLFGDVVRILGWEWSTHVFSLSEMTTIGWSLKSVHLFIHIAALKVSLTPYVGWAKFSWLIFGIVEGWAVGLELHMFDLLLFYVPVVDFLLFALWGETFCLYLLAVLRCVSELFGLHFILFWLLTV